MVRNHFVAPDGHNMGDEGGEEEFQTDGDAEVLLDELGEELLEQVSMTVV